MTPNTHKETSRTHRLILGLGMLYVIVFGVTYMSDPLALAPQLDARENLDLAREFGAGTISSEPFYRAVLYPWLLSILTPDQNRPTAGLLLGLGSHLLNAWLVYKIASSIWTTRQSSLLASLIYLLNPASLFYAVQILDITLGTSLFLGGILCGLNRSLKASSILIAGLLLGLSVAMRPHFLPAALVLPVAAFFTIGHKPWRAALIWIPLTAVLVCQGIINHQRSGEFRMLPWQGAYNLYAANKPEANGLYFKQSIDVSGRGNNGNPTRAESVYLYGQAHPDEPTPYSISAMTDYWRTSFLANVLNNPLHLAELWLFKAYAIVNSYEQYNNLTFSFHKDRLPLLKFNPLNWGILLILGIFGFFQLTRTRPRLAIPLLLIILSYASTLILFYASARFRLPLVPLMAVLAGGSIGWFGELLHNRYRAMATILILPFTAALTFGSFAGIRSDATYIQDKLLLANANAEIGRDVEAAIWAREVLTKQPDRREAQRTYAVSYFNLAITGQQPEKQFDGWEEQRRWVRQSAPTDPVQDAILGVFLWKWGQQEQAQVLWQQIATSHSEGNFLAQAALEALNENTPPSDTKPLALALASLLK